MDPKIIGAIIAFFGAIAGIYLTEAIRKRSRIEKYAESIMDQRLKAYQEVFEAVIEAQNTGDRLFALMDDDREEKWKISAMRIEGVVRRNAIFLSDNAAINCLEKIRKVEQLELMDFDSSTRSRSQDQFAKLIRDAKIGLKKSSGLSKIEKKINEISGS